MNYSENILKDLHKIARKNIKAKRNKINIKIESKEACCKWSVNGRENHFKSEEHAWHNFLETTSYVPEVNSNPINSF